MIDTVDEVGRVAATEGIDATRQGQHDHAGPYPGTTGPGGATSRGQGVRPAPEDLVLLSAEEARAGGRHRGAGWHIHPHCAAIHPSRLVRGLGQAMVGLEVALYEQTPVTAVQAGLAEPPADR
jgi:hypothetical protein